LLGNGVFCWDHPESIQREELRESLESAAEDDCEELAVAADDGGVERVQLRVESAAVKRSLYVISGVCDSVILLQFLC
jgi:hypothetical protein